MCSTVNVLCICLTLRANLKYMFLSYDSNEILGFKTTSLSLFKNVTFLLKEQNTDNHLIVSRRIITFLVQYDLRIIILKIRDYISINKHDIKNILTLQFG